MRILESRYVSSPLGNETNVARCVALIQIPFALGRKLDPALTVRLLRLQDLEVECLKPEPSEKLLEIGLCLLKWISSHRGLTYGSRCALHVTLGKWTDFTVLGLRISTSTPAASTMRKRPKLPILLDTMKNRTNFWTLMFSPRSVSSTS